MDDIIIEKASSAVNRAFALTDPGIHNNLEKRHEFSVQFILADKSLTKDEKSETIKILNRGFDHYKILNNEGTKRICENCQDECLATLYCEHCVRNYLKGKFSNWTSGNNDIDNLIQKCQLETTSPDLIVEWIPYNHLQNINYLTKGGCSEIYTADWVNGKYEEWDSKEKQLKRSGEFEVILKRLENVESANRSWFEESKSHLTISNKYGSVVLCYGLTKDPSDRNYMLVMSKKDLNLRNYLQQNHSKLTWKERLQIISDITGALYYIHQSDAIHRDLHSGNILFSQLNQSFNVSDLGFCGPADKPLNSIYGNLPYIAPEVIAGKETTFASDVYSIGMIMWEVSSGQPPFINYENDYDLAMKIINGIRPIIVPGTPLAYKKLMQQCWDADPTKRPGILTLNNKIDDDIILLYYQNENQQTNSNIDNVEFFTYPSISSNSNSIDSLAKNLSKIHIFEGFPEPRNATEEEQEAYRSLQLNLSIPYNIVKDSAVGAIDENNNVKSNSKRIYSYNSDEDEKVDSNIKSKKIKLNNNKEVHTHYTNNEVDYQYVRRNYVASDDENEIYNDPNLHSEDQNELEIPEDL